jgi:hypothetical protein
MPPLLGIESFDLNIHHEAQKRFQISFGGAFAQWSLIEERLSYWFELASGMRYEMARKMFFTPRVFQARTDILEAVLTHTKVLLPDALCFIKAATMKAGQFSSFRNQLAHGEQSFDNRRGSATQNQFLLVSGKSAPHLAAQNAVTMAQLDAATDNFRVLAKLLMDAFEGITGGSSGVPPEECRQQLNELPNRADIPRLGPTS